MSAKLMGEDMNTITSKFLLLQTSLESAAFLVSSGKGAQEAHSEIIKSLILLSELKTLALSPKDESTEMNDEQVQEINKVSRRLKLWAKRQSQINSKILNAFLQIERRGVQTITENDIKNELSGEHSFESNFSQMKMISAKNHGKIFEQYGEVITLWKPIISIVREYEKIVFG